MTACCPHCGGALPSPSAHRGELERQLGDVNQARELRQRAADADHAHGQAVRLAGTDFIAWSGYVWAKIRTRKAATCRVTGAELPAGSWAWRQLSDVADREWRVSVDAWGDL